jgi:hypothetical protein
MNGPTPETSEIDAVLHQAFAHHQAGRFVEAEKLYRQTLTLRPAVSGVHVSLGLILVLQGRIDEAAVSFRRAVEIAPDDVGALHKLGNLLLRESRSDEAIARPDLSLALAKCNRIEESFAYFARHARLAYGNGAGARRGEAPPLPHKLRHDREQQDYLGAIHGQAAGLQFHLADGSRLSSPVVNPANAGHVAQQWQTSRPQTVVIDNFLTKEALEKLRRFCWGSTIWRTVHAEGYLIALPEHGFACPLLAQIDEELRATYAAIFHAHLLRYLWAFKYDSKLAGVGTHADPAGLTVNFWITEDEANLDPEHGGMIIWDAAAPIDWKTDQYIGNTEACRTHLARMGAKPAIIPHRANRAVIFESSRFGRVPPSGVGAVGK